MATIIISAFIIGYLLITLEHNLKIDKIIPALAMMSVLWSLTSVFELPVFEVNTALKELEASTLKDLLLHHLGKTSEILMFLIGAMTIVEIIDYFDGFSSIKSFIKTRNKKKLLWVFATLSFFLSSVIDNLTATIVLITILQKIIFDKKLKFWYVGIIVISANAGGAWSPIGDVTTTMLWIAGKVSVPNLIQQTFLESVVCCVLPTFIASLLPIFKGSIEKIDSKKTTSSPLEKRILFVGIGSIVLVPIFKTLTGLPPYIAMGFSLAMVCLYAEILSKRKFTLTSFEEGESEHPKEYKSPIHHSLSKIEFSSILFFFGILMSVAVLESLGYLFHFAEYLNEIIPNKSIVIMIMGVASSIIDNVPLVAAGIGMFTEANNDPIWHELAYSSGTGGSILIIGSAAGVIAMGMEKINFFEYLRKISLLALVGFLAGYFFLLFV